MDSKTYLLTIKTKIDACDDPHARTIVKQFLDLLKLPEGIEVKLQEIFPDKQPRPIAVKL